MSHCCIVFVLTCFLAFNEANTFNLNLRSMKQTSKERIVHEDVIPDPTCKNGVMSPDMKVCCTDDCGSCGNHDLCDDLGKFHEVTGKLADNCCKGRILDKKTSCDKDHAPCVLSASYKESLDNYVYEKPNRHAMDDCNKAKEITRAKHALGIDKGQILAQIYLAGTKYEQAKEIAVKVSGLCKEKTAESKELEDEYAAKIAKATVADRVKDPLSGASSVMKWQDARENEEAEVHFYKMISGNAKETEGLADKGIENKKDLRAKIDAFKGSDVSEFVLKAEALSDDAEQVFKDAQELWKQWEDSSKDYGCSPPPEVANHETQCDTGNTKFSPKCAVKCKVGYDGEGTSNKLRCNKQGKFGKQLYGEWQGMAACVGRSCGNPSKIDKSKTIIQEIRFPHAASYVCYEGFSTNREATGPKAFNVPCGATGSFEQNSSHVCQPIRCGSAPPMKRTMPVKGEFQYTEVATYQCVYGSTTDGTPGGLKSFSSSCQATGEFTDALGCKAVRCGPPPIYEHTSLDPATTEDQYFGGNLVYTCASGYTINQKSTGPDHFTLVCDADGEFAVKDRGGDAPLPKCQPVSAGMAPQISHGNFVPREMFFGESALVVADTGYSTSGNVGEGIEFVIKVTADGKYAGVEDFIPVLCGEMPVEKATTSFSGTASFGDLLNYDCENGYSVDKTGQEASESFTIQCEATGLFSEVPGLGKCANIDDCADHTCGPHGSCVDHLMNYTCNCESGFAQSKDNETGELVCGNVNDCGPEACGVGNCIDGVNSYKCDCPTGFEQIDEEGEDGKVEHTCRAVICGLPPDVEHGVTVPAEDQVTKITFPNVVTYECEEGHTLDGKTSGGNHFSIECPASAQFTAAKSCKTITCDHVPEVQMGATEATSAKFNESIRYDCAEGHTVDGSAGGDHGFTVTCQSNGHFGQTQDCKAVTCGEPDEMPNSYRASKSLVYQETAEYECFAGFTLDGHKDSGTKFKVECRDDGKNYPTKKSDTQCVAKICGEPPKEINVMYGFPKDEGKVSYPHSAEIMCRDGYTVGGEPGGKTTFMVECTSDGEFEQVDPRTCQPVKCGAPPLMPNATMIKLNTPTPGEEGLTVNIFQLPLELDELDLKKLAPTITKTICCSIDVQKSWDLVPQKIDAPHALRFSGALMVKEGGEYEFKLNSEITGSSLFINDIGVIVPDDRFSASFLSIAKRARMNRTEPWTWPAQDGDSEIYDDPEAMGYFDELENNFDAGEELGTSSKTGKITLEEGAQALTVEYFTFGAGITLLWKGPDSGNQWKVVDSFKTKGGNLNYEETAQYQCSPGFTTGGEFDAPTKYNVECLATGQLSGPTAEMLCRNVNDCERHTCGAKGLCVDLVGPAPAYTCDCEHGYEIQTKSSGEKYCGNVDDCQGKDCGVGVCEDKVGDYTCSCPSGYYVGEKDGSKTCVAVRCSADTPVVENGEKLSAHSGAVDFPTTLRYQCAAGYSIDGTSAVSSKDFQSQCKADGQLFGMKTCQKISCGSPHVLPNTELKSPSSQTSSIEYGDKAKYKCFDGFEISNNQRRRRRRKFKVECQETGHLTDPEVCEPVRCGVAPRVPKSRPGISGLVSFGQQLIYTCDVGYTLDSTLQGETRFSRQCKADGDFSDLSSEQPCQPVSPGNAPIVENAVLKEYAGRDVTGTQTPRVFYPNGLEYRCNPGYSLNGGLSGATKLTVRVNSRGQFNPAVPSQCKKISFTIRGRIKNARNAMLLSGATIKVQGTNIIARSVMGYFALTDVSAGDVTLVYERQGFIKTTRELNVRGNVNAGGDADVMVSPEMARDEWRAVLQWGATPRDLDTYAKWNGGQAYYGRRSRSSSGISARLEVDWTSGHGPETLHLTGVGNCRYSSRVCDIGYSIHDYSNSYGPGKMTTNGGASVALNNGDRQVGRWNIRDCPRSVSSDGTWWHVFVLDGKTNQLKWSCNQGAYQGEHVQWNLLNTNASHVETAIKGQEMTSTLNHGQGTDVVQKTGLRVRTMHK